MFCPQIVDNAFGKTNRSATFAYEYVQENIFAALEMASVPRFFFYDPPATRHARQREI